MVNSCMSLPCSEPGKCIGDVRCDDDESTGALLAQPVDGEYETLQYS